MEEEMEMEVEEEEPIDGQRIRRNGTM